MTAPTPTSSPLYVPPAARLLALAASTLLVALAATAAPAHAQSITFSLAGDYTVSDDEVRFNIRQCQDLVDDDLQLDVAFNLANASVASTSDIEYAIKLETASSACTDDPDQTADGCTIEQGPTSPTSTATFSYTLDAAFSDITGISSPSDCYDLNQTTSAFAVAEYIVTNIGDTETRTLSERFRFTLATTRPENPPTDLSATAGENSIRVSYTVPDDADDDTEYAIYLLPADDEGALTPGAAPEEVDGDTRIIAAGGGSSFTIDSGLSVNTTYEIAVVTQDADENESLLSEVITVTTQPTDDFYESYRNAGGGDAGGFCTTTTPGHHTPTSPWAPLAPLALALGGVALARTRRDRSRQGLLAACVTAAAVATAALAPSTAHAQAQDPDIIVSDEELPSGSFNARLGVYLPEIDDEFGGEGPYSQIFGDDSMWMLEAELGRYFARAGGAWGVNISVGYMNADGKALDQDGNASVDDTSFTIAPFRLSLSYHLEALNTYLDIPLVPVFKLGADYYVWWIRDGDGSIAGDDSGNRGYGGTFGWHASAGLYLLLDFLDPSSAQNLKFDFGIDNSYLFAEFLTATVDDFGSSSSFNLSDDTYVFGLSFDY